MKAVIMAGGEGTRLRPLTANQPKPMLPMANAPMAEQVVHLLRRHGFERDRGHCRLPRQHDPHLLRGRFGVGSPAHLRHRGDAARDRRLGAATPVTSSTSRFLVISGDVLTDVDLTALVEFHAKQEVRRRRSPCKPVENPLEFGIVIIGADGRVDRFLEKPGWGEVFSDTINTGIYVLEPEVFDWIPSGRAVDFSSEVFPAMLEAGRPAVRIREPRATGRTSARSRHT